MLAEVLGAAWPGLEPGPNIENEKTALVAEQKFAASHGQSLLEICREAEAI
jgi:hypothetical protein